MFLIRGLLAEVKFRRLLFCGLLIIFAEALQLSIVVLTNRNFFSTLISPLSFVWPEGLAFEAESLLGQILKCYIFVVWRDMKIVEE